MGAGHMRRVKCSGYLCTNVLDESNEEDSEEFEDEDDDEDEDEDEDEDKEDKEDGPELVETVLASLTPGKVRCIPWSLGHCVIALNATTDRAGQRRRGSGRGCRGSL